MVKIIALLLIIISGFILMYIESISKMIKVSKLIVLSISIILLILSANNLYKYVKRTRSISDYT
jgi:hypothetical protein